MERRELLYTTETAEIFSTDDAEKVLAVYTDTVAAAGRSLTFAGKGALSNRMSNTLFRVLESGNVKTAFLEEFSAAESIMRKTEEIPLSVTIRNYSAGEIPERLGIPEGTAFSVPAAEIHSTKKGLEEPLINGYYAIIIGAASEQEIVEMTRTAFRVNELLSAYLKKAGIELIDVRLTFGRLKGEIVLTGSLTPDTMRLWDAGTHEKMDRDRLAKNLGHTEDAYREAAGRLSIRING